MAKVKELPSQEYLKECFDYDVETGNLIWRKDRPISHFKDEHDKCIFNSKYASKFAGSIERQ